MWLHDLYSEVNILWELRRFLVRNGLQVTLRDEVSVASAALLAVLYLRIVQVTVFLFGPFFAFHALGKAKLLVEQASTLGAELLARVPAPRKADLEQRWAHHLQVLRAG